MESTLDSRRPGPTERSRTRWYYVSYLIPFVLFVLSLRANWLAAELGWPEPWPEIATLIPIAPALWMGVVVVVFVARSDEYQRRLTLQASGVGFVVMLLTALVLPLLEQAGVADVSTWGIFGLGLAAFGVARVWMRRR
ncbi:hypothetical protein ABZ917_06765 [Nonomuraea wenchangensis]|jgi:hypothetical protein